MNYREREEERESDARNWRISGVSARGGADAETRRLAYRVRRINSDRNVK